MNKIKRVSLFFRFVFQFLFIILPVLLALAWFHSPDSLVLLGGVISLSYIPHSYSNSILHVLNSTDRLFGFSISTLPLAIELYILYTLIKLFNLYEQGEIFALSNVRYIRHIGYALLLTQILNPIYEGLMGLALTWRNPPGHHFAAVSFGQTNLGIIFMALIVILVSWIMTEGCKLREEQQLTI